MVPQTHRHTLPGRGLPGRQDGIARQFDTVHGVSLTIGSLAEEYRRLARRLAAMADTPF